LNPDAEAVVARHEIRATLDEILSALRHAVRNRGRVCLVYPANRCATLLARLIESGFAPKRLQVVASYPGGEGRLVLVEAVRNGGEGMRILPGLAIFRGEGEGYGVELERMLAP